jgi:flavin reductase (DIM6/NTAB) family NADH-FMN oxidoreductase RutF
MVHTIIKPIIFYWGTSVVFVETRNTYGTASIGPISPAFWLGNWCMLGVKNSSQTTINLLREKQCGLNLPSDDMILQVNAMARTAG